VFKFITNLLVKSRQSKIRKLISQKQTQAVQLQRNGKLREYAEVMKEIDDLEDEYEGITNETV
tara:strand:+ start:4389 stop:4577 length:189 start_codon:yes stop_codon:yes gene_type:complete